MHITICGRRAGVPGRRRAERPGGRRAGVPGRRRGQDLDELARVAGVAVLLVRVAERHLLEPHPVAGLQLAQFP